MQTLQGIRFLPVTRVDGILLGLDAAWLGVRGWGLMLLLTLAALAGPLTHDAGTPNATPKANSRNALPNTRRSTSRRSAPSAIRIPISLVERATV